MTSPPPGPPTSPPPRPPDDPGLPNLLATLVARLRRAMRRAARARQPSMPLSVAQLELLSVVEELGKSRPGELAQVLRLAPNSVSTLANALVGLGMLTRSAGDADKRAVEFSLTDDGVRSVNDWREVSRASLVAAVAALTDDERRVLASAMPILHRIVVLLDEQTDTA